MTTDWEALELSSVSRRTCESWDRGAFDPRVPHRRRDPRPGGVSESAHKGWGRGDGEAEADALEQHVLRMGQMGGRDAAGLAVDAERKMAKAYLTRNATRVSTRTKCQQPSACSCDGAAYVGELAEALPPLLVLGRSAKGAGCERKRPPV